MEVSTSAVIEIERPREELFARLNDADELPNFILPKGPIPGIKKAYVVGGGELKKGAIRRLVMTDGVPLDEEFLEFEPPRKVHYALKGFRGPLSLIAKQCEGQWVFSPLGNGTRISWSFTAHLTSPLAAPAAIPVIKVFMKDAMETSLRALKSRV
jgi:carbon monoxide dehydrogenase subunit G